MQPSGRRAAIAGLISLALAGCGIEDPLATSSGACGTRPAEPGPDGCALVCRASAPVNFVNNAPQITVWIDGRAVDLTLDTGAGSSSITAAVAASLALPPPRPVGGQVYGIGGAQPRRITEIGDLVVGGVRTGPRTIDVSEYSKSAPPQVSQSGVLGAEILSRYEVELDFPHSMLRLYEGRSCPGNPPGWSSGGTVLPFGSFYGGQQPVIPVRLDGHPLFAVVDSGAARSAVSLNFARRANVSEAALASELQATASGFGPDSSRVRLHQFRTLQIGTETVPNFGAAVFDLRLGRIDMLLGDNYLRQRKVWISYSRHEVRVTSDW